LKKLVINVYSATYQALYTTAFKKLDVLLSGDENIQWFLIRFFWLTHPC